MRLFAIYFTVLSMLALLLTLSSVTPSDQGASSVLLAFSFTAAAWSTKRCFAAENSGVVHDSRRRRR